MRSILNLLTIAIVMVFASSSFAALSNANNPHRECVVVGSLSADGVVQAGPSGAKKIVITAVELVNGAAIAASDTDYVILELRKGTTVIAEMDSRAAHENGIGDKVREPLNLVSAELEVAALSMLNVNYNETDAGTNVALTSALVCYQYWVK